MKKIIFIIVSVLCFSLLLVSQNISDDMATLLEKNKGEDGISQIKKLLKEGDIDAKDKDGFTALILASRDGHADIVKKLISSGAEVNKQSANGLTALMAAANLEDKSTMQTLIESGVYINAQNKVGAKQHKNFTIEPTIALSKKNNFDGKNLDKIKAGKPFFIYINITSNIEQGMPFDLLPQAMYAYLIIESTDRIDIKDIALDSGGLAGKASVINSKSIAYTLPFRVRSKNKDSIFIFKMTPDKKSKKSSAITIKLFFDGERRFNNIQETIEVKRGDIPFIPFF